MSQIHSLTNDLVFQKISETPIHATTQCVGFARNWLETRQGLSFAQVKVAADIWLSIDSYINLFDASPVDVINRKNGSCFLPGRGDLIIYHQRLHCTGHVAVVTSIDNKHSLIEVAEQNYQNRYQSPNHRRQITFIEKNNNYWLQDFLIVGWKQSDTNDRRK